MLCKTFAQAIEQRLNNNAVAPKDKTELDFLGLLFELIA